MKILLTLLAVASLTGCGYRSERISKEIETAVARAVLDEEVVIISSSKGNALLVLQNQTMQPENMDFKLYLPDAAGRFDFATPSDVKQNVTAVDHPPFRIGWSGATLGKGYLYPPSSHCRRSIPADLLMYRTRTNDLTTVDLNIKNTTYERIE